MREQQGFFGANASQQHGDQRYGQQDADEIHLGFETGKIDRAMNRASSSLTGVAQALSDQASLKIASRRGKSRRQLLSDSV